MSKRAVRRHHRQRIIEMLVHRNRNNDHWYRRDGEDSWGNDPRLLGLKVNTRVPCSRSGCCGNPRPLYGPTIQERRHLEAEGVS